MKQHYKIALLFIMALIFFPNSGACLWPFSTDNGYNEKEIIQKYIQFEKKKNFSDEMMKTIEKAVKGKGKKNFTLRMAYMRLRYYKAVQDKDQSSIRKVSNEAESLLKGDHPLFRQHIGEHKVQNFLSALKDARYNEKRSTNWKVLIIFMVVGFVIGFIAIAFFAKGSPILGLIGGIVGLVVSIALFYFLSNYLFYKVTVDYSNLPSVPILG